MEHELSLEDTIISFAPLLDPDLPAEQLASIMADLRSAHFHPERPDGFVAPTFDLKAEGFDERRYWRGPVWINTNWLLWAGLTQHGQTAEADEILLKQPAPRRRRRASTSTSTRSAARVRHRGLRLDGGADARPHRAPPGRRTGTRLAALLGEG